jgi:hypothetical protein
MATQRTDQNDEKTTAAPAKSATGQKTLVDHVMDCSKHLVDRILSVFGGGSARDK